MARLAAVMERAEKLARWRPALWLGREESEVFARLLERAGSGHQ
jgi:hypothetical protein